MFANVSFCDIIRMVVYMSIGERIRQKRKELKMTQAELAAKAGVSRQSVVKYERDERTPPVDIANRIADALDESVSYISSGKGHYKHYYDMETGRPTANPPDFMREGRAVPLPTAKNIRDNLEYLQQLKALAESETDAAKRSDLKKEYSALRLEIVPIVHAFFNSAMELIGKLAELGIPDDF